ncbi:MAG: glycosyl transferase, partial [Bradyrhizobium sp.]
LIVQANTGWLSGYRRDATVRSVGVGWRPLAAAIEAARVRAGASCVLAMDYGTTAWLSFYLPPGTCVLQPIQRIRWVNFPEPDPKQLAGTLLFLDEAQIGLRFYVSNTFTGIVKVGEAERRRGPLTIETYAFYAVSQPKREVIDRTPPPELNP